MEGQVTALTEQDIRSTTLSIVISAVWIASGAAEKRSEFIHCVKGNRIICREV